MQKFVSTVSAAAIALTSVVSFTAPSVAAPVAPSIQSNTGEAGVQEVGHRRGYYKRGKRHYYNGHRGYRSYHRGYRRHNGYWFPPAAFALGAIIGGAIAAQPQYRVVQPRGNAWAAHVGWCYDRYRSYRQSDNTFQPYHGPRKACVSPYYR